MDRERIWERIERAGFVVTPLCAVAGAYYAAGTYYGWDKQAATHTGGSAMTLPPWLGIALLGVAIASLLTSWGMIFIRRRAKKPKDNPSGRSPSIYAPIVDMEIDGSRLGQAAPWLFFDCFGYNATGYSLQLASVSGRIKIGSEEFHGQIEFDRNSFMHPSDFFYVFSLRIPLTKPEAEVCMKVLGETPVYIEFIGASIEAVAHSSPANSLFQIKIPRQLKFEGEPKVARASRAQPMGQL
jgi:hypothetical protein